MATQAAGSGPSTLEFALVRHLPCPTDALSSYSLGEGRCWERLGRNTHLLPGWSKPRDMNEVGHRVHGMERGRCIYYLMTETGPSSPFAALTAQHRVWSRKGLWKFAERRK